MPKIMGILNITPDSFYAQSRFDDTKQIQTRALDMVAQGATFLDIGAYSSRPGAAHIETEEEWARLAPALAAVREVLPSVLISVDTFRATIAKRAVQEFGVNLINDISAGEMDAQMFATVAQLQVPYIIMHMLGTPQTMQENPAYDDLMSDLRNYFSAKLDALSQHGLHDVIIDPGFGFGKTLEQNYELLSKLGDFAIFEQPLLVGVSRKSMIYKALHTSPEMALNGTTALNMVALQKGAKILRVHDVREASELVQLCERLGYFV